MIDKTAIEAKAIKDARRAFAEILTELGLIEQFFHRSPQDIDRIIEACIDGFQDSMARQASSDKPFDDSIAF